ncbi:hypothetical protein ACLOJK_000375 [Asimina triloba]
MQSPAFESITAIVVAIERRRVTSFSDLRKRGRELSKPPALAIIASAKGKDSTALLASMTAAVALLLEDVHEGTLSYLVEARAFSSWVEWDPGGILPYLLELKVYSSLQGSTSFRNKNKENQSSETLPSDPLFKLNTGETADFLNAFPVKGLAGQRRMEAPPTPRRSVFNFSAGNLSRKSWPSKVREILVIDRDQFRHQIS